jgi:hypothetical protein
MGATLVASLLATLARPATWALALATFLLRGGYLLVLAPIVVLPSAVGLSNVVTPLLSTVVFHGVSPSIALAFGGIVVVFFVWLIGGGIVAAAAESELVRRVMADEESWAASDRLVGPDPVLHPASRVLAVRLIAQLPLLLTLAWGAFRIASVAYGELTSPSDVAVPLALRVVAGAADAVGLVIAAWLIGETVGGLAARRVIVAGDRVPSALRFAVVRLFRQPLRCAVLAVVPLVPLGLVIALVGLAGSATWEALRAALEFSDPVFVLALVMLLVVLFAGGMLLIGVVSGWRGAIWTVDVGGTFGAMVYGPVGQWNDAVESGTLNDLRPRGVDPDTR